MNHARLSRQVMGYVVIGGMMAASFVARVLIPVLFYLVEKYRGRKPYPKRAETPVLAGQALAPPIMNRKRRQRVDPPAPTTF